MLDIFKVSFRVHFIVATGEWACYASYRGTELEDVFAYSSGSPIAAVRDCLVRAHDYINLHNTGKTSARLTHDAVCKCGYWPCVKTSFVG